MPNMPNPYFDADSLPPARNSYVAWMDVMGIQAMMSRSLRITANFVFKLHITVLEAQRDEVELYPVMDGVYVVSENQSAILQFLTTVFQRLAELFVTTRDNHHRFLVKAALAYGPVWRGRDVSAEASKTLSETVNYRDSLLLGMPVVQAYLGERTAPPFGVFVHESARAFAPVGQRPLFSLWWNWFQQSRQLQQLAAQLGTELHSYFEWCQARALAIAYDVERIKVHKEQASQYLVDVVDSPDQVSGLN